MTSDPSANGGRVFIAQLWTETNSFSPIPTALQDFEERALHYGDASLAHPEGEGAILRRYRDRAEADGWHVVESICAAAQPGGLTVRTVYEALRDRLLADLERSMPVSMLLLSMHGAMMADGYDDCEGDTLSKVRAIVGAGAIIGVELDPHCHLSAEMIAAANILITYKEYPHVDKIERADELYELCAQAAAGEVTPVRAIFDCRMLGFYPTKGDPMRWLLDAMTAAEAEPGILSVSLAHGFPWGDSPDLGTRLLVIADKDQPLAEATADRLGRTFRRHRAALRPQLTLIPEALKRAAAIDGPVVLADTADNAGGGAPSDNMTLLRAILDAGIGPCALGLVYDPMAVQICRSAGIGARLSLRIGGKLGQSSGPPLDVEVEVMGFAERHAQTMFATRSELGPSAWVRAGAVDVVLTSFRRQTFGPDAFTGLGINLADKALIAVKSSEHFRAGFSPLSTEIIPVATPGAIQMDFAAIPYRKANVGRLYPISDTLEDEA